MQTPGLHHVTAIAGDPQANVDFYAGILGLRLIKQTVNFDDPSTYHLYYGDHAGTPGTVMTFFPYGPGPQGRRGTGQAIAVSFVVAPEAVKTWNHRLQSHGIRTEGPFERLGESYIAFDDADGTPIEIIGSPSGSHQLAGFHSVTLSESITGPTSFLLTDQLGYKQLGTEGNRTRFVSQSGSTARIINVIDVLHEPDSRRGSVARGSIHHIAFRAADAKEQLAWRGLLYNAGQEVTPVMEREYFESIYFREPGGALFEIATDPPGFTIDESLEQLGRSLQLPPWLEPQRVAIEARLPKLRIPEQVQHAI